MDIPEARRATSAGRILMWTMLLHSLKSPRPTTEQNPIQQPDRNEVESAGRKEKRKTRLSQTSHPLVRRGDQNKQCQHHYSASSTPITSPPTITIINGNNPAIIQVGATYADLGAAVTESGSGQAEETNSA